ncbi:MAG: YkgJ family cysteine cluster protein [Nanoarchaeota archaeon]|nr:YkgJ family cysteine cluster protein [Nanoarchaeota archaeon]
MNLCHGCDADCCRYISVKIEAPDHEADIDEIRWFLLHEKCSVYLDLDNDWMLEVKTPCSFLKDSKCMMYKDRPKVCREHDAEECEINGDDKPYKVWFDNVKQFDAWLKERKK